MKFGYDWRQPAAEGDEPRLAGGAYAFDSSYTRATSAAASHYGQGIAAFLLGLPDQHVVHRASSANTTRAYQPRLLRARRLARVRSAHAQPRHALRPRARHDRGRQPQRRRDSISPRRIRSRRRRRRASPPTRRRACRSRRASSASSAATPICRATSRRRGTRIATISSRGSGVTYKLDDSYGAARRRGLFVAPFQLQGVPGIITASIRSATRATRRFR